MWHGKPRIIANLRINDEKTFLYFPEKPEYGIAFYVAGAPAPSLKFRAGVCI
jgi:hypothetical protein